MKRPLSRFAPSPSLASREGDAPGGLERQYHGCTGLGRASFVLTGNDRTHQQPHNNTFLKDHRHE